MKDWYTDETQDRIVLELSASVGTSGADLTLADFQRALAALSKRHEPAPTIWPRWAVDILGRWERRAEQRRKRKVRAARKRRRGWA